jgi:mono/diheme cytochrome c family protein
MNPRKTSRPLFRFVLLAAPIAVACIVGCESAGSAPRALAETQAAGGGDTSEVGKGGAELWSQNCGRCHNLRPPNSFSSTQWDVITLHMRIRANLTAEEYRQIRDYLTGAKH